MKVLMIASAAGLSAPAVLVTLMSVILLLIVRVSSRVMNIPLSQLASRLLDGTLSLLLLLYLVLVIVRFKIIG